CVTTVARLRRNRMFLSSWRRFVRRLPSPSRQRIRYCSRSHRPCCEELEPRMQPSVFTFATDAPDGRIGTITEPANAHNSQVEYESADDFILPTETKLTHAAFTGLRTGGATPGDMSNVVIEIYRVFPNDPDVGRTSGPPVFSTENVPTRVNSPSDVAFDSKNSASDELKFHASVIDSNFTTEFSVSSADKI